MKFSYFKPNINIMSYCIFSHNESETSPHREYHEKHYGFPVKEDDALFGRLILEINQAGLSWTTILKKQENFKKAYSDFNIVKVAAYDSVDIERLLSDAGIIRNKLKVHAAIHNAQVLLVIIEEYGSFDAWLYANHPKSRAEWTKLFKKTFKFVGGEIVNEFLMSIGYLPGAHDEDCVVYNMILKYEPKWLEK
jgi:DNA-3-methyladenine glycosylase I